MSDYAGPILTAVGYVVGSYFGYPQLGMVIGSMVGGAIQTSNQVLPGPKIGDVQKQTSAEGGFRPIVYGRSHPIMGNVIADGGPIIIRREESQGKGGPKVDTEYAYRTYAVGFCEGEASLLQVWRNGILVYDVEDPSMWAENLKFLGYARWHNGSFNQMPDASLQGIYGAGGTPFFRGTAYLTLFWEDVTDQRGAWSQWQVRVFRGSAKSYTSVPYPMQSLEAAVYRMAPTGGTMRQIMLETMSGEQASYGLLPVGGTLRSNLANIVLPTERSIYGLVASGGTLRNGIVATGSQPSFATYGLTPSGGSLKAALLSAPVQPSMAAYGLTPSGGSLT